MDSIEKHVDLIVLVGVWSLFATSVWFMDAFALFIVIAPIEATIDIILND